MIPLVPSVVHVLDAFTVEDGQYFVDGTELILGDIEKRLNIGIPYSCLKELEERGRYSEYIVSSDD